MHNETIKVSKWALFLYFGYKMRKMMNISYFLVNNSILKFCDFFGRSPWLNFHQNPFTGCLENAMFRCVNICALCTCMCTQILPTFLVAIEIGPLSQSFKNHYQLLRKFNFSSAHISQLWAHAQRQILLKCYVAVKIGSLSLGF
jgi:hypothetical protein